MKLQRILAKDSRSANEQAIAKYGRDVLVVSNSRVNGMTELIVAVDVEPEKMPPPMMPRGGGEPFENALRQQFQPTPAQEPASSTAPSAARASGDEGTEAFMPAHMALMQAAQRAAAQSLGQTEPLRPSAAPVADAPFEPKHAKPADSAVAASAAFKPVVRYGQQFSLSTPAMQPLPSINLQWTQPSKATLAAQAQAQVQEISVHPAVHTAAEPLPAAQAHGVGRRVDGTESNEASTASSSVDSDKAHALTDLIRAEIAQLRKEMRMGQQLNAWAAQGPSHRWNEALADVGVPTGLRALLMSGLSNDFDDEQALAAIEEQMAENLPALRAGRTRRGVFAAWTSGVHLLSGPCGSGKTSMAARLANEAAQRLGVERVVLVSWNDNRPGAWGQLQLWASRIGVSAFRAADSGTLDLLLQEHRGSLIIVDTGLSQPDILNAAVQGLNASHHLVMPADANAATLRRWVGAQAPAWCDVLITRLDESAQPWPLLQACCEHQLSPVMASDGGGLNQLRLPYDAQALLQHGMSVLAGVLGAHHGESGHGLAASGAVGLEIPTIDRITTTVPPRQAGRSGRSTTTKPAATGRGRTGAPHA